jgi:hypothetical protein
VQITAIAGRGSCWQADRINLRHPGDTWYGGAA